MTTDTLPALPVQFKPEGGCTCAGPDGPCEACIANREAYEEWLTEPVLSPKEAMAYARAAIAADRAAMGDLDFRGALKDLCAEFKRVFPIYYYAEPWAHDRNAVLLNAELLLAAAPALPPAPPVKESLTPAPALPVARERLPDDVASLLCNVADNLGDMPISDEWAAETAARAVALAEKYRAIPAGLMRTPQPSDVQAATDAPERIYLQMCDEPDCTEPFGAHEEITWHSSRIHATDAEYVRADLAQPPAGAQWLTWQPIETAPEGEALVVFKDGTRALIQRTRDYVEFRRTVPSFDSPTHWMPLPAAPAAQQEQQR